MLAGVTISQMDRLVEVLILALTAAKQTLKRYSCQLFDQLGTNSLSAHSPKTFVAAIVAK